jgi:lipoate-protein ligase A
MALDDGLLQTAERVVARRYTWSPPAMSLGRFQRLQLVEGLPLDVVRRPSGGRAVLHGEGFEWSFAVVFPLTHLPSRPRDVSSVTTPYCLVADAFAAALERMGVSLDAAEESAYASAGFCFSRMLRHDLAARGEKIVAVAQARSGSRVLVHGSVLERRPSPHVVTAAEALLNEVWRGEGLAGAGYSPAGETLWGDVLGQLEATLRPPP